MSLTWVNLLSTPEAGTASWWTVWSNVCCFMVYHALLKGLGPLPLNHRLCTGFGGLHKKQTLATAHICFEKHNIIVVFLTSLHLKD